MKKQYNIPSTTMVSFCAGSICQTSAGGASGPVITGPDITGGGEQLGGNPD